MNDYFGLYIEVNSITNPKLINHINNCNSNCHKMSYGGVGTESNINAIFEYVNNLPYIEKSALILVLPDTYLSNPNLNNDSLYEDCIGHCYIFYDNYRKLLMIFDVCIHQHISTIKKSPLTYKIRRYESIIEHNLTYKQTVPDLPLYSTNNLDYSNKEKFPGWGSILIDSVLNTLSIKFDSDIMLWLCVDLKNNSFEEASNLYIKYGFKNPFLTNVDPMTNSKFPNLCTGLTKYNEIELPNKEDREQVFLNILYIFDQYIKINKNETCSINIFFNDITVKMLHNLISKKSGNNGGLYLTKLHYVNPSNSKCSIKSIDQTSFYWEISKNVNLIGSYNQEELSKEIHHHELSYTVYPYFDVINKPTTSDYLELIQNNILTKCVITKDGVFFISFSDEFYSNSDYVKFIKNVDINIISIAIENIFKPLIINSPENYSNLVSSIILEDIKIPLFKCQFINWDQAIEKTYVRINYLSEFKQCYINPITKNIIKKIYTVNGTQYPNFVE